MPMRCCPLKAMKPPPCGLFRDLDCHYNPKAADLVSESAFRKLVELDPKK